MMKNEVEYSIRDAQAADIKTIVQNIREADRQEIWASTNLLPFHALKGSFLTSRDVKIGQADDTVLCMFGCKAPTMLGNTAVPWMIGTNSLSFHGRKFLRESIKVVEDWRSKYEYMENYVDARNEDAIRWLQWVGFSVYYPKPYGPDGLPFHRFSMER